MLVLLGTVFVASLVGSLHCVGMCGPFALLAASGQNRRSVVTRGTALYSFGRFVTYSIVGVVFGTLGMALNQGTHFSSWQQSATYVAGGLMIVVGLVALARCFGWKLHVPSFAGPIQQRLKQAYSAAADKGPSVRAFLIGALSSLMPCGWLYTFAIAAAGTGHPVSGMLVMIVFWAGTLPIMVTLALGVGKLSLSVQQRLPMVMAGMVIAIGIFTISMRAPVALGNEPTVVDETSAIVEQLNATDHQSLPCCEDNEN